MLATVVFIVCMNIKVESFFVLAFKNIAVYDLFYSFISVGSMNELLALWFLFIKLLVKINLSKYIN